MTQIFLGFSNKEFWSYFLIRQVNMRCGTENKVTNAFEPNRCVYEFDFLTPARCTHSVPEGHEDIHDEL